MMDDIFQPIVVGLCIFIFALILTGIGSFYGGDWETVAQGVTMFLLIIVGFYYGALVLMKVLGRN